MNDQYTLDTNRLTSDISVKMLRINMGHILSFDKHLSSLCKKARIQHYVISRLHRYLKFKKKKTLLIVLFITLITVS